MKNQQSTEEISLSKTNYLAAIDPGLQRAAEPMLIGHGDYSLEDLRLAIRNCRPLVCYLLQKSGLTSDVEQVLTNLASASYRSLANAQEPIQNLTAYIKTIAGRECRKWISEVRGWAKLDDNDLGFSGDQRSPESVLVERADLKFMLKVLKTALPVAHYEIYLDYTLHGIEPEKIARSFLISPRRVYEIVQSARQFCETILSAMQYAQAGEDPAEIITCVQDDRSRFILSNAINETEYAASTGISLGRAKKYYLQARRLQALALEVYQQQAA